MNDQEVLVMLTPRVVRLPEPSLNGEAAVPVRPLAVGRNAQGIEGPRPFEFPTPSPDSALTMELPMSKNAISFRTKLSC